MNNWHQFWYGHKKELVIVGYDGICNVWGCRQCETPQKAERRVLKQRSKDEW